MRSAATLERRLARLEADEAGDDGDTPRLPWFAQYGETLTDEEFEVEADWLIPTWMRHFIRGGMPGYPNHDGRGGLAEDPSIAPLWAQWHERFHFVRHEVSMGRIEPDLAHELYDFWTVRNDAVQEYLRRQLVERLLVLLPEGIRDLLTEWEPSSPEACTITPSPAYWRWRDGKSET
jgi:hypothetical protein